MYLIEYDVIVTIGVQNYIQYATNQIPVLVLFGPGCVLLGLDVKENIPCVACF